MLSAYQGLEDEQDTLKMKTSDDIESEVLISEEELILEIETLQQKTVTTSFSLQSSDRDKLIKDLQQSVLLKGN